MTEPLKAITTQTAKAAILAQLAALVTASDNTDAVFSFDVRYFPVNYDGYQMTSARGALLLHYIGSVFSDPTVLGQTVQDRKVTFQVTVKVRDLKDDNTSDAVMDAVRDALTGFKMLGAQPMYPIEEKFLSQESGVWTYAMRFQFTMKYIGTDRNEESLLGTFTNLELDP